MKEQLEEVYYTAYRLRDEIVFLTNNVYGNNWFNKAQRAKILRFLDCALKNNSNNELEVICELEDGKYQKHYVYLNEYTLYVVEDLSGSNVSKYSYELNFLPEMIPGVKITSKD